MKPAEIVVYALCFGCLAGIAESGGREKRELRFPKGASVVVALALASFLPEGPADGLAHLLEFDLGFPFPQKFSVRKKQSLEKNWKKQETLKWRNRYEPERKPAKSRRTKRNWKETQRKDLLLQLQESISSETAAFFNPHSSAGGFWTVEKRVACSYESESIGFDGSACVSRFRCELRAISPQNSLLEQLLGALFKTTSEEFEGECERRAPRCRVSLLQILMHSERLSSPPLP